MRSSIVAARHGAIGLEHGQYLLGEIHRIWRTRMINRGYSAARGVNWRGVQIAVINRLPLTRGIIQQRSG